MKKLLLSGLLVGVLAVTTGYGFANAASYDIHFATQDSGDSPTTLTIPAPEHTEFLVFDGITHLPKTLEPTDEFHLTSSVLSINTIEQSKITGLSDALAAKANTADTVSYTDWTTENSYLFNYSHDNYSQLLGWFGATSTTKLASGSVNGFMSSSDKTKLDGLSGTWSWSSPSRSIVTGTGATGFQPSSTRNATIRENVKVTTTASIAGNADGYVALEVAPTNSATAGDWIEAGRCGNSQALTLAITLQSVQGTTCQLTADVPPGYYAKLRSVTTTGTVSYAFVSAQEVLK